MYSKKNRIADAKNPKTSRDKFLVLLEDCELEVIQNVILNPSCPKDLIEVGKNIHTQMIFELLAEADKNIELADYNEVLNIYSNILSYSLPDDKSIKDEINKKRQEIEIKLRDLYLEVPENIKVDLVNDIRNVKNDNTKKEHLKIGIIIMGDFRGHITKITLDTIKHWFNISDTFPNYTVETNYFIHHWNKQENKAARVLNYTPPDEVESYYKRQLGNSLKDIIFQDPNDKKLIEKFLYYTYLCIPAVYRKKRGDTLRNSLYFDSQQLEEYKKFNRWHQSRSQMPRVTPSQGGPLSPFEFSNGTTSANWNKEVLFKIGQKMLGQYESQQEAFKSLKQYEIDNNFKYDIIVRLRSDNAIFGFGKYHQEYKDIDHTGQRELLFSEVLEPMDKHIQGDISSNIRYKLFTQRLWYKQGDFEIQEHTWLGNNYVMTILMENWFEWLEIWLTSQERLEKLEYRVNYDTHHVWAAQIFNIAHRFNQHIIGEISPHLLLDYSSLVRPPFPIKEKVNLQNLRKFYKMFDTELANFQSKSFEEGAAGWEKTVELPDELRNKWNT